MLNFMIYVSARSLVVMGEEGQEAELLILKQGGVAALATLFSEYEPRLERIVRLRVDARLRGRVDSADILQETFLDLSRRLPQYLDKPAVPLFVWVRSIALQVLVNVHRRHLGAKARDARLEDRDAAALSAALADSLTSPSQIMLRDEAIERLRRVLDTMPTLDREILNLRHFEELSNNEVAAVLGIKKAAASNRYVRALIRLRQALDGSTSSAT